MRTKTIILGAIAALALATLSVNAGSGPQRSAQGSAMSLVAGTAAIAKTDRDEVSAAVRTTTTAERAEKPDVEDVAEAPKGPVSAACQTAIDNLKALREADVAEDAAEKAAQQPPSASAIAADKAEDKAEAEHLRNARMAVRAACLPQPSAACLAAIASLKALREADVAEDAAEKAAQQSPSASAIAADKAEDKAEAEHLRNARMAVRTACLPQPSAACRAAIASLATLREADVAEDAAERAGQKPPSASAIAADRAEDKAEAEHLRTAVIAVRTACGDRD